MNLNALEHSCMKCEYGGIWTNNGVPCGNTCKHPDLLRQRGTYYGLFHTNKTTPARCPKKNNENKAAK